MEEKSERSKRDPGNGTQRAEEQGMEILSSKQEVADYLRMHVNTLEKYLAKYPFEAAGQTGKVMGRWRVPKADVNSWFRFVQEQERRHPDARRMRPAEPPSIKGIIGR